MPNVIKKDLVYPELSYKIVGVLFETYNKLGGGLQEKHYQNAIAVNLKVAKINFQEQFFIPLKIDNNKIGSYFLDFLVENKIILEIKKGENFKRNNIKQSKDYLESTGFKLGILVNFSSQGLQYKRIVNIY